MSRDSVENKAAGVSQGNLVRIFQTLFSDLERGSSDSIESFFYTIERGLASYSTDQEKWDAVNGAIQAFLDQRSSPLASCFSSAIGVFLNNRKVMRGPDSWVSVLTHVALALQKNAADMKPAYRAVQSFVQCYVARDPESLNRLSLFFPNYRLERYKKLAQFLFSSPEPSPLHAPPFFAAFFASQNEVKEFKASDAFAMPDVEVRDLFLERLCVQAMNTKDSDTLKWAGIYFSRPEKYAAYLHLLLEHVIRSGDVECFNLLLAVMSDSGIQVRIPLALNRALDPVLEPNSEIWKGRFKILETLLSCATEPQKQEWLGFSYANEASERIDPPLFRAVASGSLPIVDLLLNSGVSLFARNALGQRIDVFCETIPVPQEVKDRVGEVLRQDEKTLFSEFLDACALGDQGLVTHALRFFAADLTPVLEEAFSRFFVPLSPDFSVDRQAEIWESRTHILEAFFLPIIQQERLPWLNPEAGFPPLFLAIRSGYLPLVQSLLNAGSFVDAQIVVGEGPAFSAIEYAEYCLGEYSPSDALPDLYARTEILDLLIRRMLQFLPENKGGNESKTWQEVVALSGSLTPNPHR